MGGHTDGPHAWSTTAMGNREGFVEVEMHHVEADATWPDNAQQSVQICAVTIHQAAAAVDQLNDLFDMLVKKAKCVRVGEHHADNRIIACGFEGLKVYIPARIRWNRDYL